MSDPVEGLAAYRQGNNHLAIGCPLFKVKPHSFLGANSRIMWAVLDGLRPNKQLRKQVTSLDGQV